MSPRIYLYLQLMVLLLLLPVAKQLSAQQSDHHIQIVAHRGASKFAPENTMAAMTKAWEMGADLAEIDVRQTKDGYFVLMHDANVKRTTDGEGLISEMTLKEVQQLDAGSWFSKDFEGEKVPLLRDVLKAMKGNIKPDLDFKAGDPEALVQLLEEEGYLQEPGMATLYTGNWQLAKTMLELTDGKVWVRPPAKTGYPRLDKLIEEVDPPLVNISMHEFTVGYVHAIQHAGKKAFMNCLNRGDKKRHMKRAIKAGVDYIQCDNLDVLIPLVEKHIVAENKK